MKNFKNKVKEFAQSAELKYCGVCAAVMSALACSAHAEDATSATVTTALQTGFTSMKTDAINVIAIIVPIALSIAGLIFITRKAISWFKSLAK